MKYYVVMISTLLDRVLSIVAIIYCFFAIPDSRTSAAEGSVFVLYAGSLGNLMEKDIGPAFTRATGYQYTGEAKGSVMSANLIKERLRNPDVFVSADPDVNRLLMGTENGNLVRWYVTIFGNAMVLGYNPQSRFAPELSELGSNTLRLFDILQQKEFRLGRGDPKLEPKGYRTLFLFELAEKYYNEPGIGLKILNNPDGKGLIFPEEQLVARLEAGQVDAGIFYRNEVAEHNLPYIPFPRELDLSDPALDAYYGTAKYVDPKGIRYTGSAIVYSVTIPENCPNRPGAVAMVNFLLSDQSREIIKKHALRTIPPVLSGEIDAVPETLRSLLKAVATE
jgi:molybdate/tungstate transport system substrate-binding protein